MKRIEFYKPQKSGNGTCATFENTSSSEDQKKNGFYINLLKQHSWNDSSKTGSFKENVNNPEKHKKIKLNDLELCNILYVLESNSEKKFSTVHKSGDKTTPIFFEPYIKDGAFIGHVLKIDGIGIAFNLVESVKLREYIKASLQNLYS
jgi:hypothetical protein